MKNLPEIPKLPDIPQFRSKSLDSTPISTPEPFRRAKETTTSESNHLDKASPNIKTEYQSAFSPNIKTAGYRPPSRTTAIGSKIPSPKRGISPTPATPPNLEDIDEVPSSKRKTPTGSVLPSKSSLLAPKASVLDRPKSAMAGSLKSPSKSALPVPKSSMVKAPEIVEEEETQSLHVRSQSQSSIKAPASYKPQTKVSRIASPNGIRSPSKSAIAKPSSIARPKSALGSSGH